MSTHIKDLFDLTGRIALVTGGSRGLGLQVAAEGVESEAQAAFCSSLGFGELQGYLFSRPLPPEELKRYLAASSAQATQDKSRIAA